MTKLTIDIDPNDHSAIKAMAAMERKSMRDFILDRIFHRKEKTSAAATLEAIQELREGKGIHYASVEALFDDIRREMDTESGA